MTPAVTREEERPAPEVGGRSLDAAVERQQRPSLPGRRRIGYELILLVAIVALAFGLRAYGIGSGFPNLLDEGEQESVGQTLTMISTMDLQPDRFLKPVTFSYLLIPPLAGAASFLFGGFALGVFQAPVFLEMWRYFYVARVVSLLFAVATVPLLHFAGKEMFDRRVGLLAALLLALYPTHLTRSQLGNPYAPSLFFAVLAFYFIARVYKRGAGRDYALAGLSLGFATAIQYNVALLVVPLVLAHLMRSAAGGGHLLRKLAARSIYLGLLSSALGFVIGNPFVILSYRRFVDAIFVLLGNTTVVSGLAPGGSHAPPAAGGLLARLLGASGYYVSQISSNADMGLPAVLLFLGALGLVFWKRSVPGLLLLSFIAPTWLAVSWFRVQHVSYALPIVALSYVLVAWTIVVAAGAMAARWRAREAGKYLAAAIAVGIAAIAVWLPLQSSLRIKQDFTTKSNYVLAQEWVQQNLDRRTAKIARDEKPLPVPGYLTREYLPLSRRPFEWYLQRGYTHFVVDDVHLPYSNEFSAELQRRASVVAEFPRNGAGSGPGLRVYQLPPGAPAPLLNSTNASFGDALLLRGYLLDNNEVKPADKINVLLEWEALANLSQDYDFVVGIEKGGNYIIRAAHRPLDGLLSTRRWTKGQVVRDDYDYLVPRQDVPTTTETEQQMLLYPDLMRGFRVNLGRIGSLKIEQVPSDSGGDNLRLTLDRSLGSAAASHFQVYGAPTAAAGEYNVWLEVLDEQARPLAVGGTSSTRYSLGTIRVVN